MENITVSLQEVLIGALIVVAILALIYLIVALAKLIPGLVSFSHVMKDVEDMSNAAKQSVDNVKDTVTTVTSAIKEVANEAVSKKGFVSFFKSVAAIGSKLYDNLGKKNQE